jgi:phage-related protein
LRPTIDVLKEAATKIAEIENPAKQAALAMDLFGARSGTQLIPLLKEGGAGIEELMGKAKDLGIEISTKSAQAADEFKDKMTSLTGSLAGAGRTIGEVLIPAIIPLIEKATEIVGKISLWAEENPRLIETITKVGAVVGIVAAVGGPILMAVAAFGKISGAISAIGTISTGPIGLLILAIGAVVLIWKNWDTIVTFVEDWYEKIIGFLTDLKDSAILKVQEMIDWIVQKFEDLANLPKKMLDWGKNAVSGLADGIKSKVGDIGEACKSVGNKVKNFFGFESPPIEGPLSTSDQWMPNMMTMFGDGIYNNMDLVLEPLKYTGEKIEENIDDTTSAIGDLISDLKTSMQSGLSSAFYNILSGSKTFGEAMKDLWKSIIDAILQQIAKLAASWVIKLVFGAIGFDMGGIVKEFQSGGEVKKFQFGGMTDTVMAKLDIGEYVISKPMTDFIRRFKAIPQDLISAIAGGLPTPIPAFAGGGSVGTPNITASSFGETKIYIDIHDNRIDSEVDIKRLAVTISDEVLRKIELKRRH